MKTTLTCLHFLLFLLTAGTGMAQVRNDSIPEEHWRKNVIRYNLSGAMLFGAESYIVFGYERVTGRHQSFSVNAGTVSLPHLISVSTEGYHLSRERKNSGYNLSADYRFYLAKENKHLPPHGLYIGPYYSFNRFKRENTWTNKNDPADYAKTNSELTIHMMGFELGYQFILWKRITLDLLMVGPGWGVYNYDAQLDSHLSPETKQELYDGLKQLLTKNIPGMDFVLTDKQFNSEGTIRANALGYRYIIHLGFCF